MHDIKEIRKDPEKYREGLKRRGVDFDVDQLLTLDRQKRELTAKLDSMRQQRNEISKKIGEKRKAGEDSSSLESDMRQLNENLKKSENREKELELEIKDKLFNLPNLPASITPVGLSEKDNVVLEKWGDKPSFDFEPKDHLAVAERLGILDFKRGSKIAGTGFPVWSGAGALMERALLNFMLDLHTKDHGYREMMTPFLGNRESMEGSAQIPNLEEDMYHCPREDIFLIPTSEVTLVNLHRDEIIDEADLPIKYAAYSPCFRREAGAYGHTTRGFLRVHQFNKVEMVRFEKPEDSYQAWDELRHHAEEVIRRLEIPYRTLQLCAGDMSFQAAACIDLEIWAPADGGKWLEVSSISNCEDFQARRANIRYRPRGGGKTQYPHIINGSGLATSRLMVAILENYQTEEGSLAIPPVLRPYMGGMSVITANPDSEKP